MDSENIIAIRNGKTIYRDGDNVIKCFDENYSKENILNEALNHARVEGAGLTVPKLVSVSQVDGRWAITTKFIEGKTLEELMKEHPEQINEYMDKFIDIQLGITSQEVTLLNGLRDKLRKKFKNTTLSPLIIYNVSARLESFRRENKICHGDFNPSNVIITNDGTAYTLDWSHVTIGNPDFDYAMTYIQFILDKREDLAELYINKICSRLNIDKVEIQGWLPISAASTVDRANEEEMKILDVFLNVIDD